VDPVVVDNERKSRFETTVDGHVAELTYRRRRKRLVLVHTGVPDELEGRGIGSALVSKAVADARERGLTIVAKCPFASAWLRRHPEAAEGVEIDWRASSDPDSPDADSSSKGS
jgi:predicted GNAT family acetyltransferase